MTALYKTAYSTYAHEANSSLQQLHQYNSQVQLINMHSGNERVPDWCRLICLLDSGSQLPVQLLLQVLCILQNIVAVVGLSLQDSQPSKKST